MCLSITFSMPDRKNDLPEHTVPEGDCIVCGGDIAEVNADGGYCLSCGHYSPAGEKSSKEDSSNTNAVTNDIPF